ncbi:hypothetical protein ABFX02_07G096100 [Erythranthe guttata]
MVCQFLYKFSYFFFFFFLFFILFFIFFICNINYINILLLFEVTIMETREASPTHFLIKTESFYKSGMDKFETNEFVAGDYKWRLIIHPNGDGTVKYCDYVSVYLAMADTSSLPANWEVNVVFSISL